VGKRREVVSVRLTIDFPAPFADNDSEGHPTGSIEQAMIEAGLHPLESILRMCAAAAPEPWYPRLFATQEGVDRQALGFCLEELWMRGLIERTDGGPEKGPAIALTREGQRVLLDPEALERLRAGQPLSASDRGAIVRLALSGRIRPSITRFLVVVNVLIFLAGYWTASKVGAESAFLRGSPITDPVRAVLVKCGALLPDHIIEGDWWRLLSTGFVHIGFLHILMNMTCLFLAGRFIEQMWGHVRYLVIYLAGLLGGSCLGVAHTPVLLAGASGAICGLLAAEAVWFLLNRRYLPRPLRRQARTNFFVNLVLLVFISSFKDVSAWGHFGGAAAGALAALLLQLHQFGPPLWRWLALAGFAPLIWYGHFAIEHARASDSRWQKAEALALYEHFAKPVAEALNQAKKVYQDQALPVLERHPTRRDASKVEKAVAELEQQRERMQELEAAITRFGPLFSPQAEEMRQLYRSRLASISHLLEEAESALRNGDKWQTSSEREQRDFEIHYLRRTDVTLSRALAQYRERIRPLVDTAAERRTEAALDDAKTALAEQGPRLAELVQELKTAGPYDDKTAEEARETAQAYAAACLQLFESAQSYLHAGDKGSEARREALSKQEKKVDSLRREWKDLVE
jgi:membrane associated rhomboid family serine protease